jgi:hypothetical protein
MADLLKTDDTKKQSIKVELPDGTSGEIPMHDAGTRTEIIMGYGEGGVVEQAPEAKAAPKPKRQKSKKDKDKKKQKPQPSVRGKDILV